MKKAILFLTLIISIATKAQYNDGKTKVDVTSPTTYRITNLQNCPSDYRVRMPDLTFFTTAIVQPNQSILVELGNCLQSQVFTNVNCSGSEPLPVGIEVKMCYVLVDNTILRKISLKNGYIEVMLKFTTMPTYKYYFVNLKMSDGTVRRERITLEKRDAGWYFGTVKL